MEIKQALNWRYATKAFDNSKKLDDKQLNILLDAVQLAPTSYGLQPFQILVITNPEIKEKLKSAAYGQAQLTDASHIFVFAVHNKYTVGHVDEYAENICKTRNVEKEDIKGFIDVMKGTVESRSQEELKAWNTHQAYIALGFLLESAALNELDACPMEGFDKANFDEILNLGEKNLTAVVIAAAGFRSSEDKYQFAAKVRKSKEDLFIHI